MVAVNENPNSLLEEGKFNKKAIAQLSSQRIAEMNTPEMISIVRSADLPVGCQSELENKDITILRRMVYLARRSCRHQVS